MAVVVLVGVEQARPAILMDQFDDGVIDSGVWETFVPYGNPRIEETGGVLETECTASGIQWGGLRTVQYLGGDFDFKIDYDWIMLSGSGHGRAQIWFENTDDAEKVALTVHRIGTSYSELILGFWTPSGWQNKGVKIGGVPLSGALRLERTGSSYSGYYLNSGNWSSMGSFGASTSKGRVYFQIVNESTETEVEWDNFYAEADHITPEPSTLAIWSLLALCGIGYGWRRRKA